MRTANRPRPAPGLGLVVLALAILMWPSRTDRILTLLLGIGLGFLSLVTTIEVVRDHNRRRFWPILSIGVGTGMAAALLVNPQHALRTSTQLAGAGRRWPPPG